MGKARIGCHKLALMVWALWCLFFWLEGESRGLSHGRRYNRLVIENVMVIDGNGTPAKGPVDIVVQGNRIRSVGPADGSGTAHKSEPHVIDGDGLILMPGLINIHAHIHNSRGRQPLPVEYLYKLWLACGITCVRDVGSDTSKTMDERQKSRERLIVAPRIYLYMVAWENSPQKMRNRVQEIKKKGGDGVKIFGLDRDIMTAAVKEAKKLGLPVAHHVGVEETDVRDDASLGVTSIEHWYGVPDAALNGSQNFPPWYNYSNENHRFRYAGHLWQEADPVKLRAVLRLMVDNGVAWNPTFVIYEANRDLLRAKNQPWFREYLHPVLEDYFKPNPENHGSYHWDWRTADEIFWKKNYSLWMAAVREFANLGGVVGVGEDAGYIYMLYGFSLIREMELHQEAGFHPLDVIMHATLNNARILGLQNQLGRIRSGYLADFILVDGNPLKNLKVLYPTGILQMVNGEVVRRGGVKWTVVDGVTYHAPSLLEDVKKMVSRARGEG